MSDFERDLKLWSFLHAFQQSPHKYLYMYQMLDALEQIHEHSRDSLVQKLKETNLHWIPALVQESDKIMEEEKQWLEGDFKFLFYGEKNFPIHLRRISDPPLAISYQGDLNSISSYALSVVGAREPHEFSRDWMQSEFYSFLKAYRPTIISGGARGIDQKAHLMATLLDISTVVLLPSGLGQKYPSLWSEPQWKKKPVIFVSEMRLGEKISKKNFSSRNRLIAAWGVATLIVEAHGKSGTMITAHHALTEGRPLWVVPAHPLMPSFAGSLDLCMQYAQIVRNATDLSINYDNEVKNCACYPLGLDEESNSIIYT